jgi:hypothetical protein
VAPRELLALVNSHGGDYSHGTQPNDEESHGVSWDRGTDDFEDIFGDFIKEKEKDTLRISFQNIGGLGLLHGNLTYLVVQKPILTGEKSQRRTRYFLEPRVGGNCYI